jgi:23S rRNA (guanosine2251-2'-O)-methyltransferase
VTRGPRGRHGRREGGAGRGGDRGPARGGDRGAGRGGDRGPARGGDRGAGRGGDQVLYGRNPVREALRGPRTVRRVWATPGAAREGWEPAPVAIVPAEEVARIAGTDGHQGVAALVSPVAYADPAALLARPDPVLVALDEVTDPQNLGAVIRTAECAGASGVVIPERRAAEVTPAVAKASAGAVEHLPVARVRNLADFLADAQAAGCWTYGAAADATTSYDAPDYSGGVVLVLGAEGRGLRPRVAGACDELVSLPLRGRIASLNVSAAAAVLLYRILQ